MARHRRRSRRRSFGGIVSLPGLGALNPSKLLGAVNPLGKNVRTTDVLIGAVGGMAAAGLVQSGINKVWKSPPTFITENMPLVTAAVTAIAASLVFKKNAGKAQAYAFGALLSGLIPVGWAHVQKMLPASLKGITDLDMGGFLVSDADRALNGFLVNDQLNGFAEAPHMAALADHAMGEDEDDVLALRSMTPDY